MLKLLIGALLFMPLFSFSQIDKKAVSKLLDSASYYQYANHDLAIKYADSVEQLILSFNSSDYVHELIQAVQIKVNSSNAFSRVQMSKRFLSEGTDYIEKYKDILGDVYPKLKIMNELSWAEFFFLTHNYNSALEILNATLDKLKLNAQTKENCMSLYRCAQFIAAIHNARGEYEAAINQFLASLAYYDCYRDQSKPPNYVLAYRNAGQAYLGKGDYHNAKKFLDQAELALQNQEIADKVPASVVISLYELIAAYYRKVEKYDSAWIVFQRAVPYVVNHEPSRGRFYYTLAEVDNGIGRYAEAESNYKKSVDYYLRQFGPRHIKLSQVYLALGNLYVSQGRYDEALTQYQKAINSVVLQDVEGEFANPSLKGILSNNQLFRCLSSKSRLLGKISKIRRDGSLLRLAIETNQLALDIVDSTANEYSFDEDKVILTEQSFDAYEDALKLQQGLASIDPQYDHFSNSFRIVERSKGTILLENLRMVNNFAGINKGFLDRERELKSEIFGVEQSLLESSLKSVRSNDLTIRHRLADLKGTYSLLMDSIRQQSPGYYQLRFDHQVIDLDQVRRILREGDALIEFFAGDSVLTVLGISKKQKHLEMKYVVPDLNIKISRLRGLITSAEQMNPGAEFYEIASSLYDILLKNCLEKFGSEIQRITIVPDGMMGYIPFEVLWRTTADGGKYLVDDYSISYANSATYFKEQLERKSTQPQHFFAGFLASGEANTGSDSPALVNAEREVNSIVDMLGGNYRLFKNATKDDFINNAQKYRVLHLAMHSQVNNEHNMLSEMQFAGEPDQRSLRAIELYGMQLGSDLAVLSACETGMGALHRGEGIMSFSRAFSYAGVPAAVISLWKVPDKATSMIMVKFYSYLKKGNSKDEALQLAKKTFVQEYPQMSHPYYWSGFILTGNNQPVEFPGSSKWTVILVLGVCAIALVVFYLRIRKRRGTRTK